MNESRRDLPDWCKEAKKALIDRNMKVVDLAEGIELTREHVSSVINGRILSPNTQNLICSYLGLDITSNTQCQYMSKGG